MRSDKLCVLLLGIRLVLKSRELEAGSNKRRSNEQLVARTLKLVAMTEALKYVFLQLGVVTENVPDRYASRTKADMVPSGTAV